MKTDVFIKAKRGVNWLLHMEERNLTSGGSYNMWNDPSPGVSVKFLMVGESNSMVDYHLMTEGNSIFEFANSYFQYMQWLS